MMSERELSPNRVNALPHQHYPHALEARLLHQVHVGLLQLAVDISNPLLAQDLFFADV